MDRLTTEARERAENWPDVASTRANAAGRYHAWANTALDDAESCRPNAERVATFAHLARVYWRTYRYLTARA